MGERRKCDTHNYLEQKGCVQASTGTDITKLHRSMDVVLSVFMLKLILLGKSGCMHFSVTNHKHWPQLNV